MEVLTALPFVQLAFVNDIAFVAAQLVEFLTIRLARSFDLAVLPRRAAFYLSMADAEVLDVPMELSLELVAIIRPDFPDAKRELFDDVICEIYGIALRVSFLILQRLHTRCIINRSILETAHLVALFAFESQELNNHLNVMPQNLFLIALGVNFAHPGARREPVHPLAAQNA